MFTQYIENFADHIGPEQIIHIYDPKTQLRAIVVIDNQALGPAIGGTRMLPDVSTREVFRLARAMTLKNAVNGRGVNQQTVRCSCADWRSERAPFPQSSFATAIE